MKRFDENGSMDLHVTYGFNVIRLCCMSNRGMVNYSRVQDFFQIFPKRFILKLHSHH